MYPDFNGGSILNLMSSIAKASGTSTGHKETRILQAKDINTKNIVLVVIDAVGALWLKKHAPRSFWARHQVGTLTSLMPSNTAVCVTTFFTGKSPLEHGIVGWHLYAREAKATITPLLWKNRITGKPLPKRLKFVDNNTFFKQMDRKAFIVSLNRFKDSPYNTPMQKGATVIGYDRLDELAKTVTRIARKPGRKYVYAYWDGYDSLSHNTGTTSPRLRKHFLEIDAELRTMAKKLKGTDTTLLVVADHGHIDSSPRTTHDFADHPRLRAMCRAAAGADNRTRYLYVKKGKEQAATRYIKKHLGTACTIHTPQQAIRQGIFGSGKQHPSFRSRVGSLILEAKGNHKLQDRYPTDKVKTHKAGHGGTSKQEMLVPLAVVKC